MSKTISSTKGFNLSQFNEVETGDTLHEIIFRDAIGVPIEDGDGGFLSVHVIGPAAKELSAFERKANLKINSIFAPIQAGKKHLTVENLETLDNLSIEKCKLIVKKWALSDDCSPDNIELFFRNNPTFRVQLMDELKALQDFLPKK